MYVCLSLLAVCHLQVDDEDDVSEDDDDHDEIAQLLENGRKSVTGERSSLAGKQVMYMLAAMSILCGISSACDTA